MRDQYLFLDEEVLVNEWLSGVEGTTYLLYHWCVARSRFSPPVEI